MIAFACASCGKSYTVGDDRAGQRFRCSVCMATQTVPTPTGTAPGPASTFRPADLPGMARRAWIALQARPLGRRVQAGVLLLLVGFVTGMASAGYLLAGRGKTAEAAAAVAVVPAVPRPAGQPGLKSVVKSVVDLIVGLFRLGMILVVPIVIPVVFSRVGWLSPGRWAAMAGFCLGMSGLAYLISDAMLREMALQGQASGGLGMLLGLAWTALLVGACGCPLAAALYPKSLVAP